MDVARIEKAFLKVCKDLINARSDAGTWVGKLSSSPLSTATAVTALAISDKASSPNQARFQEIIERGLEWISSHSNEDGGWGDTDRSKSNLSTTVLCWSALTFSEKARAHDAIVKAEKWLEEKIGGKNPEKIAESVMDRYGKDRTFSVPILTMAALTGRLGEGSNAWKYVRPLPFELAAFPANLFATLRLPVVSYALPALIAIGIARHSHLPSKSPIWRALRSWIGPKCLSVLEGIQPKNGGFLEATPLTSFVAMSLASSKLSSHSVTKKAVDFILHSVREDGSWPIDSNLSTWLSNLSIKAIGRSGLEMISEKERSTLSNWICDQQFKKPHPYTQSEPGGWAWTSLPGGVPDADDTAAALIALHFFWSEKYHQKQIARKGSSWLCKLQNHDGGIPTFCKGWGSLPFDRSSPDITAHAILAWMKWFPHFARKDRHRVGRSLKKALTFLLDKQRGDGSWSPLWFGNEAMPDDENLCYGTARCLIALNELSSSNSNSSLSNSSNSNSSNSNSSSSSSSSNSSSTSLSFELSDHFKRKTSLAIDEASCWILLNQNEDGGWGGGYGTPSSTEETALAIEALVSCFDQTFIDQKREKDLDAKCLWKAMERGLEWLLERIKSDDMHATPIGFYFARLWYYEKLYPLIFATSALQKALILYKKRIEKI